MSARRVGTRTVLVVVSVVVVVAVAIGVLLVRRARLVSPDSPAYEEVTRAFYHGLAALEVGLIDDARSQFQRAADIVPREPAAWANLGLTYLRLNEPELAAQAIERAATLAPLNSHVAFLQGQLETSRGRPDEAVVRFRRAVELDPGGLRVLYALEQATEAAAGPGADAETQQLIERLLALGPDNLATLLERARLAARRTDAATLADTVARLAPLAASFPAAAAEQYRELQAATARADVAEAARTIPALRNVLLREAAFREDLVAIRTPEETISEPFDRFLQLPAPTSKPSPPDQALTFSREPLDATQPDSWSTLLAFSPDGAAAPVVFAANGRSASRLSAPPASIPFPGGPEATPPAAHGMLAIDWNRDQRLDLVMAGRGGVRLLLQQEDGTFRDATAAAGPGAEMMNIDCIGAWTADIEMDGDLDIIAGTSAGPPVLLRNNGDGTWRRMEPFPGVTALRAFAWADVDRDGDPDAVLLDASGGFHLLENLQGGQFAPLPNPDGLGNVVAFALGDVNGDLRIDLVTLDATGAIRRATRNQNGWDQQTLATWTDHPSGQAPGSARLFLTDLDNNGSVDLTASGGQRSQSWLSGDDGTFTVLRGPTDVETFDILDLNGDGQLDLVGLSNGQAARWLGQGTKGYHWQVFRPRAQLQAGDQRINSFGVGGQVEIRSGLLTQSQVITSTAVHFGLGTRTVVDVARIVWPNGVPQADFDSGVDRTVSADQRLKGSCPWVFAYDGSGMRFVTDFLWRSPLGLRINAVDTAGVSQTEDWVKIGGDQLVARDGAYDVRITAELWETHFVDHVSLMAVDHLADVDVFVDERFAKESPTLKVHATAHARPVAHASDEAGRDVTELVAQRDGRYLATFKRGIYQGVAEDHFVELDLGREITPDGPAWLIANGWIYPTDSSINVAIGQGHYAQPRGLSLEAQDASGRWVVIAPDLGFPAGKNKTVLIDLMPVIRAGLPHVRRLRLRTNLEIYWDSIATADAASTPPVKIVRIPAARADLRYRGYSQTDFSRREAPEVPHYSKLANVTPRWRDLVGYYTRFGDVRELLAGVDDRYVIMNAGDELQLAFPSPAAPALGWTRDFVLVGDGWVKDGDFNTSFSKTVLPLPSHDRPDYTAAPTTLESDPVYQRHSQDWQTYHTRFVTPPSFLGGSQ